MAYCVGTNKMKSSAPTFTTSDVILAHDDSSCGVQFGLKYSR